jgi:hypothetical protein
MAAASPRHTTAEAEPSFLTKTLHSMLEEQARWTENDLKRLNLGHSPECGCGY